MKLASNSLMIIYVLVRHRWLGLLLVVLLASVACRNQVVENKPGSLAVASLILSDRVILAGDSIQIRAQTQPEFRNGTWQLIWTDAFGDRIYPGKWLGEAILFDLPGKTFQSSSTVQLSLCRNGQTLDQKALTIVSGPPVEIVESYAGNKTMVANSRQRAMVVAIPKDTFGNPVQTGTPVQFQLRYPGGREIVENQLTDNLVSAIELDAGVRTGKILIGTASAAARSIEETVALTPAWPTPFRIAIENLFPFADARQQVEVQTDFLQDAAGNPVADGTLVWLVVYERGQLVAKYQGFTSSGSARIHIENPDRPADWEIYALAEGKIRSNAIQLSFAAYVTELPFHYDPEQAAIIAGPIAGNLGQIVTDDLQVDVQLMGMDTTYTFSSLTDSGYCRVSLPSELRAGKYQCRMVAGGKEAVQELSITF